jgi:uncharacterized protein
MILSLMELVGQVSNLTVVRKAEFGYFLSDGKEEVLLHSSETEQEYEEGDTIDVFLYPDNHGRVSASAKTPAIVANQYGWVQAVDMKEGLGVFLDIGIQKDILLGVDDLPAHKSVWPQEGDLVYTTIRVNRNYRLYAKLASDNVMEEISIPATREDYNKNIHGHIYRTAKVGSWIFTSEGFKGFIHESQRKIEPRLGEKVEGRIIDVKEDGTINVSLIARKEISMDDDAKLIWDYLVLRDGAIPYGDKSMPEDILERFNLSKAAFKRALGKLMKEDKVYQDNGWTYIKEEEQA